MTRKPAIRRLVGRLAILYGVMVLLDAAVLAAARAPLAATAVAAGLIGQVAASLLIGLVGLLGTLVMLRARGRDDAAIGRAARRPQALIGMLGLAAAFVTWRLRPLLPSPDPSLAAVAILAFPLLLAERFIAAEAATGGFMEAESLRRLLLLPVLAVAASGACAAAGVVVGLWPATILSALLGLAGLELALRGMGRLFLPAPSATSAHALTGSLFARVLSLGPVAGLAAPLRERFGIDISRSWALAWLRRAALPALACTLLAAWLLTGVRPVAMDRRGAYARFGAPAGILAPGLHLTLPWPLGRVVPVEYGIIHTLALGGASALPNATPAEGPATAADDRLWDRIHPTDRDYLIASLDADGRQSLQVASADLSIVWRIGMTDAAATDAAYGIVDPQALVAAEAGRLATGFFAGRELDQVMGADREALAGRLRDSLQAALDRHADGVEVLAVIIEAIHPPLGAAAAYHDVQAAQIVAETSISTERGRAAATAALARQESRSLSDRAHGLAADLTGEAESDARRFAADREAAKVGGRAFLLERYFADLATALPKTGLIVVDNRLAGALAPVIDLRPPASLVAAPPLDQD